MKILGVDIGGVIIDRVNDAKDTSFGNNYLQTTAVPDAFNSLAMLSKLYEIHLVSKCGEEVQKKTSEWLSYHDFFGRTGINPVNTHYCRERRQKRDICDYLKATHFVDDRLEVLSYLPKNMRLYLFRPSDKEVRNFAYALSRVVCVNSWLDLTRLLKCDA